MIKKILSMLLCLSMLLSLVCIPSVSADASYAFKNVFVGEYTSAGTTLNIGWKNPVSDTITKVALYDITDGTETLVSDTFATTSGTVIEYSINELTKGTPKTYKLKSTFSDADPVEYMVSGCPQALGANIDTYLPGANSTTGEGFRIQLAKNFSIPPYVAEIDTTEKYSDNASFHIAVDRPTNGNYPQLMYYVDKTKLTANASHLQLEFYVKGNDLNGVMLLPKKNQSQWFAAKSGSVDYSDWTKKTWTAAINAGGWISFGFAETAEDFWIDDFAIYEVTTDGTVLTTNLAVDGGFETAETAPAAVTDAAIEVTGTTAKLSWTDDVAASYNVYDANGKKIADLDGTTDELYITGVDESSTLSYTIKPAATFGTEGTATTITYTPGAVVTPSYTFKNVFIGEYTSTGTTLNIGWKNPVSDTITKVALYDITDGTETLVSDTFATTSGTVIEYAITGLTKGTPKTYKVKATFSDADPVEYIVSGCPQALGANIDTYLPGANSATGEGFRIQLGKNFSIPPYVAEIDTTEKYSDNASFHIAVNRPTNGNYLQLMYYLDKTKLTANASHLQLEFYVKGTDLNGVMLLPKKNQGQWFAAKSGSVDYSDWTKKTWTAAINAGGWISFGFAETAEDFWIDDFAIYEVTTDGTVLTTNLAVDGGFETAEAAPAAVTGGTAEGLDGALKLSWTDELAARYNVYDEEGNLIADLAGETDELYITGLTNNVSYSYTVKPVATFGTEGSATVLTGTPEVGGTAAVDTSAYEFKNVIVAERQVGANQVRFSWRNPKVDTIENVSLYYKPASSNSWTLVSNALPTTNGAVNEIIVAQTGATVTQGTNASGNEALTVYNVADLATGSSYSFKLVASYSDYALDTEYTTDCTLQTHASSKTTYFDSTGQYIASYIDGPAKVTNVPTMVIELDDSVSASDGNASVHVVSNQGYLYGGSKNVMFYIEQDSNAASYKVSYKLKGKNVGAFGISSAKAAGAPSQWTVARGASVDFADWTTKSYAITNANKSLNFYFTGTIEDLWIDDVEVYAVYSDGTVGTTNLALDGDVELTYNDVMYPDDISDLNVTVDDKYANVSWTPVNDSAKTRVYVKSGNNVALRAEVDNETAAVTLGEFAYGKEYEIIVKSVNSAGLESDGLSVTVTCVPPAYQIGEFTLSSGETVAAGEVTVSIDVKNNRVEGGMSAELVVALYDGNRLVDVTLSANPETIAVTDYNAAPTTLSKTITVPALDGGNYTVKAFLWNSLEAMTSYRLSETFGE